MTKQINNNCNVKQFQFKNDLDVEQFQCVFGNNQDEESVFLLKILIKETTGIFFQSVKASIPQPSHEDDDTIPLLDVVAISDTNEIFDIELKYIKSDECIVIDTMKRLAFN